MRRVGALLLWLVAVLAVVVASIAAALALLGANLSLSPGGGGNAALPSAPGAGARPDAIPPPAPVGRSGPAHKSLLADDAMATWKGFERSLPARVGLTVAPLGPGQTTSLGSLRHGHAWSTIKVPILVTVLRERDGRELSAEEDGWARAAVTASDNNAAAALFGQLEQDHGGLGGASLAVEDMLRASGDRSTTVATAPPPPGAVSTYGQTDWSLPSSVEFFRALGRGCLLGQSGTAYVLGLMDEIVPEQRWGLGEAGFPSAWTVEMKGGWGPEGSTTGPYLVRQSGIVRSGDTGVAVAMTAQADSGSFDAGVEAVTRIATWLRENLTSLGQSTAGRC